MAINKTEAKPVHAKKEYKKKLAKKIEGALTELKDILGEKEFEHRIKKATKVLVQGLHAKDLSAESNGIEKNLKQADIKKAKSLKRVLAKKATSSTV